MSTRNVVPAWATRSPWLDPTNSNLFKVEFQLAQENSPFEDYKPIEIYDWIHHHGGEKLFFRGLARFAPMFPLMAYRGQIAVWTSPPPSGFGNAIYLIMGHDRTGEIRLVGGNYFTAPTRRDGSPKKDVDFFHEYDHSDDYRKQQLVGDTVVQSISSDDKRLLHHVRQECEHFHTMGIYITVLTPGGSLFHAGKAVIEGSKTADFSYEHFGEVK